MPADRPQRRAGERRRPGTGSGGVGDSSGGDDGGEPREFSADTPERFEGDVDDRFGEWSGEGGSRNRNGEDDEREFPQVAATSGSLRDHLLGQLAGTTGSRRDRALVTVLIDELSEDGYLLSTLEDVAASLPAELEIETAELNGALNMLQSFDPPGVGARDVAECLDLQLRALPTRLGGEVDPEVLALARAVVRDHLALLATKDFARLKRSLRCDDNRLREVQAMIVGLNPRPGSSFATTEAAYVVPDIVVRRTRAGWTAHLNPGRDAQVAHQRHVRPDPAPQQGQRRRVVGNSCKKPAG